MATILTIQVLVRDENVKTATEEMERVLNRLKTDNQTLDWEFDEGKKTNPGLDKRVANGNYLAGDAFRNWLIYSSSEFGAAWPQGGGYWSNSFGWGCRDLATVFDTCAVIKPASLKDDAAYFLHSENADAK
jgi:hypothetical protein